MTYRLRELSAASRALEARLREGGGAEKAAKQHQQGKLTARERVTQLTDADAPFLVCEKVRSGDREVTISIPNASAFLDRQAVLVDDIASSGRTLAVAARQLASMGFAPPDCVVVHPLFAGDAAQVLGIAPRTLWGWTQAGIIPSVRIGTGKRKTDEFSRTAFAPFACAAAVVWKAPRRGRVTVYAFGPVSVAVE